MSSQCRASEPGDANKFSKKANGSDEMTSVLRWKFIRRCLGVDVNVVILLLCVGVLINIDIVNKNKMLNCHILNVTYFPYNLLCKWNERINKWNFLEQKWHVERSKSEESVRRWESRRAHAIRRVAVINRFDKWNKTKIEIVVEHWRHCRCRRQTWLKPNE